MRSISFWGISLVTLGFLPVVSACKKVEIPLDFHFSVPDVNTFEFETEIKRRLGLQLSGEFPIPDIGTIVLNPEGPDRGFGIGFRVDARAFLPETWARFQEVETLPNQSSFPWFVSTPIVDAQFPDINTRDVGWHFYFGTRGQFYLGVASVISALNNPGIPSINLGYDFYEKGGRLVLNLTYFGPEKDINGQVLSPGGIFIGTNITPYLPAGSTSGDGRVSQAALAQAFESLNLDIQDRSTRTILKTGGKDARMIRSERDVKQFMSYFHKQIH